MQEAETTIHVELIQRVAEGDEQAFAMFYKHYYPQLFPFLLKHLQDADEAREVLQQIFLKVWLSRDKLPGIQNMQAWLFRIAAREYLRKLRTRITRRERFPSADLAHETDIPSIPSAQQLSFKELNHAVRQAVQQLSPKRREVFLLSRGRNLSTAEIAALMQISPSTVKNTLTAALSDIRQALEAQGYILPSAIFLIATLSFL